MPKGTEKYSTKTIDRILEGLAAAYPDAHCELNFQNPFQLLIATMLSAQSTDKKVNEITDTLFRKYPGPEDFICLGQAGLENEIKKLGLFRNKAKNILATCQILIEKYGGQVPETHVELMSLPGVGRKTANVICSNAFGIPAIAVDTHVFRVARRLGLAHGENVLNVEEELMEAIPHFRWSMAHHWLIWHGRRICSARKPNCPNCPLQQDCLYFRQQTQLHL